MLSIDTETTGVNLYHGAKPFFVTACREDGEQLWWEWAVDPLTREPIIPAGDLSEIADLLAESGGSGDGTDGKNGALVLQNAKFDVAALCTVLPEVGACWPWERTHDTLLAGHLLASNQPHDLTSMALHYLGIDITPYEQMMKRACEEARRYCRSRLPRWRIARAGLPEMPSARQSCWRYDSWLPRTLARELGYPESHPWHTALREYANTDSAVTLALWNRMRTEIVQRGLWEIYQERRKLLPVVYKMESRGITLNRSRLEELKQRYEKESVEAERLCVNLARTMNHDLVLPKSGSNRSLRGFLTTLFRQSGEHDHVKVSKKTGEPSYDKSVLEYYRAVLPPNGKAATFVNALIGKRKRDTAISYMESYIRFWLPLTRPCKNAEPLSTDWFRLHPSLNPTGTDTLRFSSSNPNEQNISKQEGFDLRYCFGPAPGREWWSLDAKNIELRIPAYESGEPELIDLFERSNEPPYYGSMHLLNFSTVYPDIWERELREVGLENVGPHCKKKYASTWYQWCKNGGFAVQYGAIDRENGIGTADRAFHRKGSHAKLKARFSRLEQLNQYWIRFAERHGYVETIPDRTVNPKRGYPILCTRTEWGRILPTVPLNYHVQGTAMWWTIKAMIRCHEYLKELNRTVSGGFYLIIQVHDELVFDFPLGKGERPWLTNLPRIRQIKRLMEEGGSDIGIPTPVDIEYHADNWSEGMSL